MKKPKTEPGKRAPRVPLPPGFRPARKADKLEAVPNGTLWLLSGETAYIERAAGSLWPRTGRCVVPRVPIPEGFRPVLQEERETMLKPQGALFLVGGRWTESDGENGDDLWGAGLAYIVPRDIALKFRAAPDAPNLKPKPKAKPKPAKIPKHYRAATREDKKKPVPEGTLWCTHRADSFMPLLSDRWPPRGRLAVPVAPLPAGYRVAVGEDFAKPSPPGAIVWLKHPGSFYRCAWGPSSDDGTLHAVPRIRVPEGWRVLSEEEKLLADVHPKAKHSWGSFDVWDDVFPPWEESGKRPAYLPGHIYIVPEGEKLTMLGKDLEVLPPQVPADYPPASVAVPEGFRPATPAELAAPTPRGALFWNGPTAGWVHIREGAVRHGRTVAIPRLPVPEGWSTLAPCEMVGDRPPEGAMHTWGLFVSWEELEGAEAEEWQEGHLYIVRQAAAPPEVPAEAPEESVAAPPMAGKSILALKREVLDTLIMAAEYLTAALSSAPATARPPVDFDLLQRHLADARAFSRYLRECHSGKDVQALVDQLGAAKSLWYETENARLAAVRDLDCLRGENAVLSKELERLRRDGTAVPHPETETEKEPDMTESESKPKPRSPDATHSKDGAGTLARKDLDLLLEAASRYEQKAGDGPQEGFVEAALENVRMFLDELPQGAALLSPAKMLEQALKALQRTTENNARYRKGIRDALASGDALAFDMLGALVRENIPPRDALYDDDSAVRQMGALLQALPEVAADSAECDALRQELAEARGRISLRDTQLDEARGNTEKAENVARRLKESILELQGMLKQSRGQTKGLAAYVRATEGGE